MHAHLNVIFLKLAVLCKRYGLEHRACRLIDWEPCMSKFKSYRWENPGLRFVDDNGFEICWKTRWVATWS